VVLPSSIGCISFADRVSIHFQSFILIFLYLYFSHITYAFREL